MKQLFVLGVVLALACAAYATYPSMTGLSGLVFTPTAAVSPAGQFQVAADWWYTFGDEDAIIPIRANYGINDQFEVAAVFATSESNEIDDILGVGGKFVLPFTAGDAAWAVGAEFIDPKDGDSSFVASLSVTKAFVENFSGTAGLIWSEEDNFFLDKGLNLALGAEATLDNGLVLVGEYINFMPGAELNMAARYPLTDALTAQVGFVFNTSSPFLGASYAFGGAK